MKHKNETAHKATVMHGRWRVLFPASLVWILCAYTIGVTGSAAVILKIFIALIFLFAVFIAGLWIRSKNQTAEKPQRNNITTHLKQANHRFSNPRTAKLGPAHFIRKSLTLAAITVGIIIVMLIRIDAIEKSALNAATHLNLEQLSASTEDKKFVEARLEVTDFPTPTKGFQEDSYAVKARYTSSTGEFKTILWVKDPKADLFSPGTKIQVSGFAKKHAAASIYSFEISVIDLTILEKPESMVSNLRTGLRESAQKVFGAGLVPGFAVGDTALVGEKLEEDMLASSLTHLIAVSGSNTSLITAFVMSIAGYFGFKRKQKFVLAAISLLGFVAVVGPDASIQRAAIMAGVALLSGFGGKKSVANASLGLAVVILLFLDPWQARAPGFTLSVAATAGILFFVPALEKSIRKFIKLPALLTLPITVSLAAQIACAPLLLLLQDGLPIAGIPANVLAAPAAPVGTGLGLAALITLPFSQPLGTFFVKLASYPARWVEATAEVTAALPLARWFWPGTPLGAVLLLTVEIFIIVAYIYWQYKKPRKVPWQQLERASLKTRTVTSALVSTAIGIFIAVTAVTPFIHSSLYPKEWTLVACDVGQGDATLIRPVTDPTKTILVDTGEHGEAIAKCLKDFHVKTIDVLVLTHDDLDHIGAVDSVLHMTSHALIAPDLFGQEHHEREVVQKFHAHNIDYQVAGQGMELSFNDVDSFVADVLWPDLDKTYFDDNASSIVLNIANGNYKYLLLGDTGADEHLHLLRDETKIVTDVFKVAHHGSGDFMPQLLERSSPTIGVISAGENNRYGHPHPKVLEALAENRVYALRTDQLGAIAIIEEDGFLTIWSEK